MLSKLSTKLVTKYIHYYCFLFTGYSKYPITLLHPLKFTRIPMIIVLLGIIWDSIPLQSFSVNIGTFVIFICSKIYSLMACFGNNCFFYFFLIYIYIFLMTRDNGIIRIFWQNESFWYSLVVCGVRVMHLVL